MARGKSAVVRVPIPDEADDWVDVWPGVWRVIFPCDDFPSGVVHRDGQDYAQSFAGGYYPLASTPMWGNGRRQVKVHRVVCAWANDAETSLVPHKVFPWGKVPTYVGNNGKVKLKHACHLDDDQMNFAPSNMRWGTPAENRHHGRTKSDRGATPYKVAMAMLMRAQGADFKDINTKLAVTGSSRWWRNTTGMRVRVKRTARFSQTGSGYVYVAMSGDLVKIGVSSRPASRIDRLKYEFGVNWTLVTTVHHRQPYAVEAVAKESMASRLAGVVGRYTGDVSGEIFNINAADAVSAIHASAARVNSGEYDCTTETYETDLSLWFRRVGDSIMNEGNVDFHPRWYMSAVRCRPTQKTKRRMPKGTP